MVVYRALTCDEIMCMVEDKDYSKYKKAGKNTFAYEKDEAYKHFFIFGDHAEFYKPRINAPAIGVYDIPEDKICQRGFGFYGPVVTPINYALSSYNFPFPEIIIKYEDDTKESLITITPGFNQQQAIYSYGVVNPFEKTFKANGYKYSYADVYYEIVNKLALEHDMDMKKVAAVLNDVDLKKEIEEYFNEYYDYFEASVKIRKR